MVVYLYKHLLYCFVCVCSAILAGIILRDGRSSVNIDVVAPEEEEEVVSVEDLETEKIIHTRNMGTKGSSAYARHGSLWAMAPLLAPTKP